MHSRHLNICILIFLLGLPNISGAAAAAPPTKETEIDEKLIPVVEAINGRLEASKKVLLLVRGVGTQHMSDEGKIYGYPETVSLQLQLMRRYKDTPNVFLLYTGVTANQREPGILSMAKNKYYEHFVRIAIEEGDGQDDREDEYFNIKSYDEFSQELDRQASHRPTEHQPFMREHNIDSVVLMAGGQTEYLNHLSLKVAEARSAPRETKPELIIDPDLIILEPRNFNTPNTEEIRKESTIKQNEQLRRNDTIRDNWLTFKDQHPHGMKELVILSKNNRAQCSQ